MAGALGTTIACRKRRCAPSIRSTSTRTRSASSSESGFRSGSSGTNESTASCVSLSRKTCLMNCSAAKQSTGWRSPHDPCGKLARTCSQYRPALLRQLPVGSTMCVCTSKTNSSPASTLSAAAVSNAASLGSRNTPPALPRAAKASPRVRSVVAAPQSDCRNARLPAPTRRACSPIRTRASSFARPTTSLKGTGRNSPLLVGSTLIGRTLSSRSPAVMTSLPSLAGLSRPTFATESSMPAGQPRPKPLHRPPRAWMSARQGRSSRSSRSSITR